MPIVLVRVDNRFIHGQMLEGWIPATQAHEVLIANDEIASDHDKRLIMETALNAPLSLIIDTVGRIAELLMRNESTRRRRIVIVSHPTDALRLKNAGVQFDKLILGNVHAKQEPVPLTDRVVIGKEGRQALRGIVEQGVEVDIQGVPSEKPVPLKDACGCIGPV